MTDPVEDAIARTDALADGPKAAGNKAENATAHSITDQLALEAKRENQAVARRGGLGIGFFNTSSPGAVSRSGRHCHD